MDTMKLLFIRPMLPIEMEKEEPLGILYLMMFLRKSVQDVELEFLDLHILRWDPVKVADFFISSNFDALLISSLTVNAHAAYEIIAELKARKPVPVIMGGPHATAMPEECLLKGADYCCLGEGEIVLSSLIRALSQKNDCADIPNLVYCRNGKIYHTQREILHFNLDELDFPDFSLLQNYSNYHTSTHLEDNNRALPIMASRGCVNDCPFCGSKLMWNRRLRFRSPEAVAAELEHQIKTYGIRDFHFLDDDLLVNKSFILRLTEEIIRMQLHIRYCCLTTVRSIMQLSDAELDTILAGGLRVVEVGIESLMEQPLKYLEKNYSLDILPTFVEKVNRHSLDVRPLLMYMVPYETLNGYGIASEYFLRTLGQLSYLGRNWIIDDFSISRYSSCFTLLPGTRFSQEAETLGIFLEEDRDHFDTDNLSFVPDTLLNDIPIKAEAELSNRSAVQREIDNCCFLTVPVIIDNIIDWVWEEIDGHSSMLEILERISDKCGDIADGKKAAVYTMVLLAESHRIRGLCDSGQPSALLQKKDGYDQ